MAQVAKIGRDSASGKTTELIKTAEAPGRLQTLLFTIVRYLAYLDVVLAVVLVITALIRGTSWTFLLPFLVILFIATIPVSMPSSFTVANSLEAQNLAKKDILVSGLVGIQEAASMNALLVDKTGTLTRNQSKVIAVKSFNSKFSLNQIMVAALTLTDDTNNSVIDQALKNYGHQNNIESVERKSFRPFSPVTKYSSGEVQFNGQPIKLMLGSPEALTNLTGDTTEAKQIAAMAQSGRLICVASTNQILGAIILADTPRPDSKKAVLAVQKLGVKVIMVTGDDIKTAKSVAGQVGIGPRIGTLADIQNEPDLMLFDGFANIFPADKLKIVKKLQQQGQVVGMTGDGINDAPALKQADVGIAVNSASDVVKLAARVVLTKPGLTDIVPIIDSGHRVYRRMMTWIITKLARTAELAALLTFGFIFTGFFPVSLSLIVFIVVMNDMVTLVLGTDRAWRTQIPERWNLPQLAKIAGIFTIGWLVIGFGLLWFYLQIQKLSSSQISSAMFLYLIYSAMATIWMTRVRDHFWSFAPSKAVGWMTFADIAVATTMVLAGLITAKISISIVLEVLIVTIVGMIILDQIKMVYYHHNGILGTEIQN
ncbi:HAD-IC family P-type ATPase [Paucilactobacillus hokkaidonensis]|uniref:HAD-IC family P-type ATPase n=1 Tax=Paucilactobacillus hokkaidonensis TaxID=1193095 RepID=UPI0034E24CE0